MRRRYSEFASLRQTLVNLHPTLVIPPIPEKHTMADYAAKPTKAKEDTAIIELRKRMLAVFLNRCRKMKEVREDGVWWRFLDPNVSWVRIKWPGEHHVVYMMKSFSNMICRAKYCILTPHLQCRKITSRHLPSTPPTQPQLMLGFPSPPHLRSSSLRWRRLARALQLLRRNMRRRRQQVAHTRRLEHSSLVDSLQPLAH